VLQGRLHSSISRHGACDLFSGWYRSPSVSCPSRGKTRAWLEGHAWSPPHPHTLVWQALSQKRNEVPAPSGCPYPFLCSEKQEAGAWCRSARLIGLAPRAAGGSAAAEDAWALPASRPGTSVPSERDGASAGGAHLSPLSPASGPARVRALADELERKRGLFEDDAAFIAEARLPANSLSGGKGGCWYMCGRAQHRRVAACRASLLRAAFACCCALLW